MVGSSSILILGLIKGTKKYTKFDIACQSIAILGVILWQFSNNPNIALVFVILTDLFAYTPTLLHAYREPGEETWATYLASGTTGLALTLLAKSFTFASLAVTAEASITCYILVGTILYRRQRMHAQADKLKLGRS